MTFEKLKINNNKPKMDFEVVNRKQRLNKHAVPKNKDFDQDFDSAKP